MKVFANSAAAVPSAKQTYQLLREKATVQSMDLTIGSGKSILQMLQLGLELEEVQYVVCFFTGIGVQPD